MDSTTAAAVLVGTVLVVGLAGASVGLGAVGAQERPGDDRPAGAEDRTITVAGQGAAEAPPDQAVVAVAVVAEGDDPAAVRDDLATGADALRAALANASVADEQVDTTEFHITEQRRSPYERPAGPDAPEEPAYRGVHAVEVTLDDVDRAGVVADAAATAGADVRYVAFGLSEARRDELRDRALADAMDDARRQADALAAAGDLAVTGVRHVDAADRGYGPVGADEALTADAGGGATDLRPGEAAVRVDVRVTYDATANESAGTTVNESAGATSTPVAAE